MEGIKESLLIGYPSMIPYESHKKINGQMERYICKLYISKIQGTGFFCKIPFPIPEYQNLPVLITNNHVINEEDGKISFSIKADSNLKELYLKDRIKFTNKEYDITIIELKPDDEICDFLELDDIIVDSIISDKIENKIFMDENIYILEYVAGELSYSTGVLKNIYEDKQYLFNHLCRTGSGSAGSPILKVNTNKVIGIHHSLVMNKKSGEGTFLNYPLKEFFAMVKNHKK
jgi:hypothetical protein